MANTNQKSLTTPFRTFLFLVFLSHGVLCQSLQDQEQTVLLKLKQHWGNLTFMSGWIQSNNSHCSWRGIACTSNSVTDLSVPNADIKTTVPPFICDLKNLRVIDLGNNYIPGEFPRAVLNCSKLELLDLSDNFLVGRLPDDIRKLVRLQRLYLGDNNFTGDMPPAIGKLQELRVLSLGDNLFNGSLPPEIGDLSNLEYLRLSNNHQLMPSRLPSGYTKLRKLKTLWVSNSNLIGEIPERIGDLEALEWLDLSHNDLQGKIPEGLFMLKNLTQVMLFQNKLFGQIPRGVEALNLTLIDLSDNRLTGIIPEDFAKLTELTGLALFSNQLSGSIPEGIGRLPALVSFKLWDNNLTGMLPPDLGKYSNLEEFQVNANRLTGKLPEHLCSNGRLVGVVADGNNFSGELPESLGHCRSLILVKVSDNKLSGEIPSGLWTSFNLTTLMLTNNSFTGSLPENFASNLTRLEIDYNIFSGKIPIGLSSLRNLVVFKASSNLLTGTIPRELTTLSQLTNLFLDQNYLTGNLPSDIESWEALNTLNLSRNQLSGQVPEKLGQLLTLTDLDLSDNKFSGQIPSRLGLLKLNFLNLSSNDLTGTIPREFENAVYANSFLNNPGLCSSNDVLQLKLCNPRSEKKDKISTRHIILFTALGAAVLLLAVSFSFFIVRCCRSKRVVDPEWKLTSFHEISFTVPDLLRMLDDRYLIGKGGAGSVYHGPLNHQAVAVKRILDNKVDHRLEKQFLAEAATLNATRHKNVVKLLCCVSSETWKLLVYEYMENRSLDQWLHRKNWQNAISAAHSVYPHVLDWPTRLHIAVGAAQGLCYMHHDCAPPIIHRDIKSSNILLDSDFNAKIADFGLALLLKGERATISVMAGSFGYLAPECVCSTKLNEKVDVYSFGVVLLELVTGREARDGGEDTCLAEWARHHVQDAIEDALDEEIKQPCYVEEMSSIFKLGIRCTRIRPSTRPTMRDVLEVLRRPSRQTAYGKKIVLTENDAAPLLKNSA